MSQLLILGAGGHGKVVVEAAVAMGGWDKIAFLDDQYPKLKVMLGHAVVGSVEDAFDFADDYDSAVVALGNAKLRMNLLNKLDDLGFCLPSIIHPLSYISPSASIGKGNVIFPYAVVNAAVTIGDGCILNTAAVVEHDCSLDCGVHVCPGVHIGGGVSIGEMCWVGIGSSVTHSIAIGNDVIIGAGSAVINSIEANQTVVGVPARRVLG